MIKATYKYTKDKNLVWNQYTLFDSLRFIHSECGSSPVQTCANKRTLLEKIVFTAGSNQRPLDYKSNAFPTELGGLICKVGFKHLLYSAIYSYNVNRRVTVNAIVASGMFYIVFIKTENRVVNEIGRIICTHLLAHAHTYFYITLLCMHDTATYNIVVINSTVQ